MVYMQKENKLQVIGYVRVSTIKQEEFGQSIETQKANIIDYCNKKGYYLGKIYVDRISGSSICVQRPNFKKALDSLSSGKAQGLVTTKFDRLSRTLIDLLDIVDEYFSKNKYKLFFTNFEVDVNTSEGRLQLQLLGAFAQLERDMIASRTKAVLNNKKNKGEKLGGYIPYGKKLIIDNVNGKEIKKLIDNDDEIKLIEELVKLKNSGYTYNDICKILIERKVLNRTGTIEWEPVKVMRMLFPEKCPTIKKIKKKTITYT